MLRTRTLISSLEEVPREWIFEYYLTLTEKLTGQNLRIKSVFNPKDRTPSMFVYYDHLRQLYKYKDFSTGRGGDAIDLVKELFNCSTRGVASFKIINDYNAFLMNNDNYSPAKSFKVRNKYKVDDYEIRHWTTMDKNYWTKYKINSKLLDYYNVAPLSFYTMKKEEDGEIKTIRIEGNNIYGYFRKDGSLYKIYQPLCRDMKFVKVSEYIQGSEQLTGEADTLIIASSLKDLMSLVKLKIESVESIAPDSENVLIPEQKINVLKKKYKNIYTLFDNDEAGIKAMNKYKEVYGIECIHISEFSKDLSDSIKDFDVTLVREKIKSCIKSNNYELDLPRN